MSSCCSASVEKVLRKWTKILTAADIPEAKQSVELIISHVLGHKMIHEVSVSRMLNVTELTRVDNLCEQRLTRVPVQYILGEWDFIDLTLKMRSPVFIPRPETENLAEIIHSHLRELEFATSVNQPRRMLEIGCGSGALSVYLLSKLREFHAVAVDVSAEACQLTRDNADLLEVDDRLTVLNEDIMSDSPSLEELSPFDVLVSNPPYIPCDEVGELEPEVTRHEDHRALDGGVDGLDTVRRILHMASSLVTVGGSIWLEVDSRHPVMIQELLNKQTDTALRYVKTWRDFEKRDRICQLEKVHA
ncbi:hypothetical protein ScPMuIL_008696 [Solemya velum]